MSLTYDPGLFSAPDLEAAKQIILTTEGGVTSDVRWQRETPYLADLIGRELRLKPGQIVLDYGCGVGRLARELIQRFGCMILGVDISQEMRTLAPNYVNSSAFSVVSRQVFDAQIRNGLRVDAAISVWVLQHCLRPQEDIRLIRTALKTDAPLLVVNNNGRAVPTVEKRWVSDGADVRALLLDWFKLEQDGKLDESMVGKLISEHTYWAVYA
jgi:SAM-dependent methyltransferase